MLLSKSSDCTMDETFETNGFVKRYLLSRIFFEYGNSAFIKNFDDPLIFKILLKNWNPQPEKIKDKSKFEFWIFLIIISFSFSNINIALLLIILCL